MGEPEVAHQGVGPGVVLVREPHGAPPGEEPELAVPGFGRKGRADGAQDFVAHRPHLKLVVGVLEHQSGEGHQTLPPDRAAPDPEAPFGLFEPGEDARERGLPGAVPADQCGDAGLDPEGDALENGGAAGVRKAQGIGAEALTLRRRTAAVGRFDFRLPGMRDRHARQRLPRVRHRVAAQPPAGAKHLVGEHRKGPALDDFAPVHHEHLVGDVLQPVETVVDHENRCTGGLPLQKEPGQLFGRLGVEVGGGFV